MSGLFVFTVKLASIIITVANLLTEENMVNDENLELVEDQYSRDVFENEVEDDNEYRVKIYF